VTAFLVLFVSASLLPGASMRDAQAAVDRADLALASRLSEVQQMSEVLGGLQTYIEYLKATGERP
jgi:hypothetical protein